MNKKMWKQSILSALLAGMWCAGPAAYADVIDMTAPENLGGAVIENPQSDVDNTYIYKWDSATEKITGGIVDVVKNTKKKKDYGTSCSQGFRFEKHESLGNKKSDECIGRKDT